MSAAQIITPAREPANAGDATQQLYERHQRRILAFCTSRLRNRQEAEDAVQNTFVYAFKLLERGVVPDAELPWLFTIAHNVCRARKRALWRRGRVEATVDLDACGDVVAAPDAAAPEGLAGLTEALASIPEAQRRALLLREWRGLSYAEIAATLSLSQSAVETLLFRARRSLAKQLATTYERVAVMLNGFVLLRFARRLAQSSVSTKAVAAAVAAGVVAGAGIPLEHALVDRQPVRTPGRETVATRVLIVRPAPSATARLVRAHPTRHASHEQRAVKARAELPAIAAAPPRTPTLRAPAPAPAPPAAAPSHPAPAIQAASSAEPAATTPAQPLDQTVEQTTSALSTVVSQAVQQTEAAVSTVSTVASSVATATQPAPVRQTVTTVVSTASNVVSQLLGQGR